MSGADNANPVPFPDECLDDLKAIVDYWWVRRAGNHYRERAGKESPDCTKNAEKIYGWIANQKKTENISS